MRNVVPIDEKPRELWQWAKNPKVVDVEEAVVAEEEKDAVMRTPRKAMTRNQK